MIVTQGSTDVSVPFYFVDDVAGTNPGEPTTGLLFSDIETGGSASYQRQGLARVDFELFTLTSASADYTPGGFILVNDTEMPGVYRLDIPDAALATGVDFVIIYLRAAAAKNTLARPLLIDLTAVDFQDSVRGGMTALPAAAANGVGGLPISDAGGLDLDNIPISIDRNMDLAQHLRGFHTHQGNTYWVAPVNGSDAGAGTRADPYKTINAAIVDLVTSGNHDTIIVLADASPGVTTHTSAAAIVCNKRYLSILGPGRDMIITRSTNGPTFQIVADGIEISGFQLGSEGASATSSGVDIIAVDFHRIHNIWFLDTQGDGINCVRGSNCQFHDNHFEGTGVADSGQGIHISGAGGAENANDNEIYDNHFAGTAGTAILIDDGTTDDTAIYRNTIHNSGGWAIDVTDSSHDVQIHDNILGNNADGDIRSADDTAIIRNNREWLSPTVETATNPLAIRTLDVTETGAGGIDWANVESQATVVQMTGTTIVKHRAFYVATDGNDSNTGRTEDNPFLTPKHAIESGSGEGDTISLGPGTFGGHGLDSGPAVDKTAGLVGIPVTGHQFSSGDTVVLSGTTNYDGTQTVHADTTTDEVVITDTFVSETFGAVALGNTVSIDNGQPATNPGGGLVGIPITGHPFSSGDRITIANTVEYDGIHTLDASTSVDEIVITATYEPENFGPDDTAANLQVEDKGDGRTGIPIGLHPFAADDIIVLSGTDQYDGHWMIESVTTNEIVLVTPYLQEQLSATERARESMVANYQIAPKNGQTISGAGPTATTIIGKRFVEGVLQPSGISGLRLFNLGIMNTDPTGMAVLTGGNPSSFTVTNCLFTGKTDGFRADGLSHSLFSFCKFVSGYDPAVCNGVATRYEYCEMFSTGALGSDANPPGAFRVSISSNSAIVTDITLLGCDLTLSRLAPESFRAVGVEADGTGRLQLIDSTIRLSAAAGNTGDLYSVSARDSVNVSVTGCSIATDNNGDGDEIDLRREDTSTIQVDEATVIYDTGKTAGTILNKFGARLTKAGGTGDQFTAIPWNASWDTEVESEVNDALVAIHLDHLLAVDYDPADKPGNATALFNELIVSDAGVSQYSVNALENAPSGSGSSPAVIAAEVWNTLIASHTDVTTFGGTNQSAGVTYVLPGVSSPSSSGRIDPASLTGYQHTKLKFTRIILDSDDSPIDLSAVTVLFKAWDKDDPATVLIAMTSAGGSPELTIGGDDSNEVTANGAVTHTATARQLDWGLYDGDDPVALDWGVLKIEEGPALT